MPSSSWRETPVADLGIVKRLMDAGADRETAVAQVNAVTAAIIAQLRAGKAASIAGVGILRAPEKVVIAPFPPGKLRTQRKVALRRAEIVEAGEPYDNLDYVAPRRSTYGNGGY